jgi:hypothetical protein
MIQSRLAGSTVGLVEPRRCGGEVVGEALAGASPQPGIGRGTDGEQALYGDVLFAENLFEALVFERRPGFEPADLCVSFGRQGQGRAAELPVLRRTAPVGVGEDLLVPLSAALGVAAGDGWRQRPVGEFDAATDCLRAPPGCDQLGADPVAGDDRVSVGGGYEAFRLAETHQPLAGRRHATPARAAWPQPRTLQEMEVDPGMRFSNLHRPLRGRVRAVVED